MRARCMPDRPITRLFPSRQPDFEDHHRLTSGWGVGWGLGVVWVGCLSNTPPTFFPLYIGVSRVFLQFGWGVEKKNKKCQHVARHNEEVRKRVRRTALRPSKITASCPRATLSLSLLRPIYKIEPFYLSVLWLTLVRNGKSIRNIMCILSLI